MTMTSIHGRAHSHSESEMWVQDYVEPGLYQQTLYTDKGAVELRVSGMVQLGHPVSQIDDPYVGVILGVSAIRVTDEEGNPISWALSETQRSDFARMLLRHVYGQKHAELENHQQVRVNIPEIGEALVVALKEKKE